jgi:chromate reductase
MRILTVVGSLQQRSANRALAAVFLRVAPPGCEIVPALRLDELPFYDSDRDIDPAPPPVARWRAQLAGADAVVFVSPEYGHGMSGVLKNALDWIVGSGELVGRAVAATCAAQGKGRGLLGLASLVTTLRAIDAVVVWSHPIQVLRPALTADGTIVDGAVEAEVRDVIERLRRDVGQARRAEV